QSGQHAGRKPVSGGDGAVPGGPATGLGVALWAAAGDHAFASAAVVSSVALWFSQPRVTRAPGSPAGERAPGMHPRANDLSTAAVAAARPDRTPTGHAPLPRDGAGLARGVVLYAELRAGHPTGADASGGGAVAGGHPLAACVCPGGARHGPVRHPGKRLTA